MKKTEDKKESKIYGRQYPCSFRYGDKQCQLTGDNALAYGKVWRCSWHHSTKGETFQENYEAFVDWRAAQRETYPIRLTSPYALALNDYELFIPDTLIWQAMHGEISWSELKENIISLRKETEMQFDEKLKPYRGKSKENLIKEIKQYLAAVSEDRDETLKS